VYALEYMMISKVINEKFYYYMLTQQLQEPVTESASSNKEKVKEATERCRTRYSAV
jgi:hypothetical protein